MTLDPGYANFWLPFIISCGVVVLLFGLVVLTLFGIWYELYKIRKRSE